MMHHPLDLDIRRSEGISIRWSDGTAGRVTVAALRRSCPCATCRALREAQAVSPLVVLQRPPDERKALTIEHAEIAGNYALRIRWADGHDTGIYDYELLHRLCRPADDGGPSAERG